MPQNNNHRKHISENNTGRKQGLVARRFWIIGLAFLLTFGFSTAIFKLKIDPDLKHYFPASMPSMISTDRIEEIFGNQDLVMMVLEGEDILSSSSLERVKAIEKDFKQVKGVRRVSSLFGSNRIYGEEGVMYVEPTVLRIPENREDREKLKGQIIENEMVYKVLVSDDFRATALILTLEKDADEDHVFGRIEDILKAYPGEEEVHYGGLPYLRKAIQEDIKRDGLILVPIALLFMVVFLFLVFREWRGVWLPFLVVIMSALIGISAIPFFGWKFYVITLLVPILLIAVANDYGIHMIARYQELNSSGLGGDMKSIASRITRDLWKPILLTGLTTVAGISSLWAHSMIPARQMAVVASIGILFAVAFSLLLLPSLLSLLNDSGHRIRTSSAKRSAKNPRGLEGLAESIIKRKKIILPLALILTLGVSTGIFLLKVDSNEENFFPEKHEVKKAAQIINGKFGGSENISVLFTGDMLDPQVLLRMEHYGEEIEKLPAVDHFMAFSGVIKEISKALNEPDDPWYDRIPPSREAVAQYMELYHMSAEPGELEQLIDFNYEHAHLMIRINDASNETVQGIIRKLKEITAGDPAIDTIGGYGAVRSELAVQVQKGTYWSLSLAFIIILILLSLIFRSLLAGMLGIIPLLISVLFLFGIMGLTGIRLDVATALLSSVMIGVGVDYSIHFLWRYREERQHQSSAEHTVRKTLATTGRGIIFNALSVMVGFIVLLISAFTPIRFFGYLVVVSICCCLLGALIILPAIILYHEPAFLKPADERKLGQGPTTIFKQKIRKHMRRIAMLCLILLLATLSSSAQDRDARTIIQKSHDKVKISSFEALTTLTIQDSRGNQRIRKNTMASMSLKDGTEKRIIKFNSPAEVRGTAILIFDYPEKSDDMWIYLPAMRKTRRIVSREKSKSFMGSEFSNANMTAPGLDDFSYRIVGEELFRGKDCIMVESLPATEKLEDEYGYARSLSWIDKKNYLAYEIRYFDADGERFKTIKNLEFKAVEKEAGKYMVTRMEAENHQNNRSSTMVMDQVAVSKTDPSYFTVAYLEKE